MNNHSLYPLYHTTVRAEASQGSLYGILYHKSLQNRGTMPKITVIGSINMDLSISADPLPREGETVHGNDFQMLPGGKGSNQSIAAARLGADVTFVSCIRQSDIVMGQFEAPMDALKYAFSIAKEQGAAYLEGDTLCRVPDTLRYP